jgi:uroporphyrinogen-III synthase
MTQRRVLISRQRSDAEALSKKLEETGYKPLIIPSIDIVVQPLNQPLDDAISAAEIIALPSPSAARFLNQAEAPKGSIVYAQGKRTAAALKSGLTAQISLGLYAADLAQSIHLNHPKARVTILHGDQTRDELSDALKALGHEVESLMVYENRCPSGLARAPIELHAAIYHSPSAAQRHLQANPWLKMVASVAIGKTTAQALQCGDCRRIIQAKSPGIEDLILALENL